MVDPDRILTLLWRDTTAGKGVGDPTPAGPATGWTPRGRRPGLTVDAIVAAALDLADAEGLAAMSMHRVAKALGVGTMTLYTYLSGKDDLVELVADAALAERDLPDPGEPRPPGWREQVRVYAEQTRAMYHRHPWLRQVSTLRPPAGPGMMAGREYLLSALAGTGLTPRQMSATAASISAYVDAAVGLEVENTELERLTGTSLDAWWQERNTLWERYFDYARYPTMAQVWEGGGFDQSAADEVAQPYTFGLERLLDGIQVVIDRARA